MAREYYSLPEAAAMLGISRIAVFKRVKNGKLRAIRFGRNWAVPASALPPAAGGAIVPPPASAGPDTASSSNEMDSMGWD